MGDLRKDIFICLDVEATGLSVETDEIIELAVVKFTFDEILDTYEALIDPKMIIPQESIDVHHITNEMIKGKPTIDECLPLAFDLIKDYPIVGHNIGYDLAMIIQAAKKRRIPCPINLENSIDTVRLARLYAGSESNKLEALREHFNIPEEGAHRAMNDVIVNIKVFKYLAMDFKRTEDMKKRLKQPIQLKTFPLGKHRGLPFREVPIDYLNWAVNQDFDQDLKFSIIEEKKRRRKRKPFSESCNPFADL